MRKSLYKKYLILGGALFLLISLPTFFVEQLRHQLFSSLAIFFKAAGKLQQVRIDSAKKIESENHLLLLEIGKLRALIEQQRKLEKVEAELKQPSLSLKHYDEIKYLCSSMHKAVPARVIYREPGSWSSSLWVSVGEETNHILNAPIIQKNSPVVIGRSLVGAVDYVGRRQSRIRLITDLALKPSVRAVRGHPQNAALLETLEGLLKQVQSRQDLLNAEEKGELIKLLEKVKNRLPRATEGWYLAKGILQGGGKPLWRSVNQTLRGIGFNYDFADDEGPARELQGSLLPEATIPIIQESDLLLTTGMDGVFPPGLRVAEVSKIYPLREGAYSYEIDATPVVGNLDSLQTVFILPPLGFELEEK